MFIWWFCCYCSLKKCRFYFLHFNVVWRETEWYYDVNIAMSIRDSYALRIIAPRVSICTMRLHLYFVRVSDEMNEWMSFLSTQSVVLCMTVMRNCEAIAASWPWTSGIMPVDTVFCAHFLWSLRIWCAKNPHINVTLPCAVETLAESPREEVFNVFCAIHEKNSQNSSL